jgi:hypothetical protein
VNLLEYRDLSKVALIKMLRAVQEKALKDREHFKAVCCVSEAARIVLDAMNDDLKGLLLVLTLVYVNN